MIRKPLHMRCILTHMNKGQAAALNYSSQLHRGFVCSKPSSMRLLRSHFVFSMSETSQEEKSRLFVAEIILHRVITPHTSLEKAVLHHETKRSKLVTCKDLWYHRQHFNSYSPSLSLSYASLSLYTFNLSSKACYSCVPTAIEVILSQPLARSLDSPTISIITESVIPLLELE